jgi:hypothetical protein
VPEDDEPVGDEMLGVCVAEDHPGPSLPDPWRGGKATGAR